MLYVPLNDLCHSLFLLSIPDSMLSTEKKKYIIAPTVAKTIMSNMYWIFIYMRNSEQETKIVSNIFFSISLIRLWLKLNIYATCFIFLSFLHLRGGSLSLHGHFYSMFAERWWCMNFFSWKKKIRSEKCESCKWQSRIKWEQSALFVSSHFLKRTFENKTKMMLQT